MTRVFPFILEVKHKTLHVQQAWAELENSAKKNSLHKLQSIESNFQSIELGRFT